MIALTATATPSVQADILAQLGMVRPIKFIHGFRRTNLAIEVVELPVPDRAETIARLLADPARRPAIVYAVSRKQSEALARLACRCCGWSGEDCSGGVSCGSGCRRRGSECKRHSRRANWMWWWRRSPLEWGLTRRIYGP